MCIEPKAFLDDVFQAITYKTYLPGAAPAPIAGSVAVTSAFDDSAPNGSRKRGFHDRDDFDTPDGRDGPQQGGRIFKQARRGGRGGRDDMRGRQPMYGLPSQPDLSSFDPNNPMEAFMQLQAMGMQYPGLPKFPPTFDQGRNQPRKRGRCRDFDTKGFCSRGSTCKFDHGNESIFVPGMGPSGEGQCLRFLWPVSCMSSLAACVHRQASMICFILRMARIRIQTERSG